MKITNEQMIARTKRIVDEVPIIDEDVDWLAQDIKFMPDEHLDIFARELVHKLHAISKTKLERVWEND